MNTPFNHIGVVVDNLDQAIERYSKALGISFAPVMETQVVYKDIASGGEEQQQMRVTYSIQGPPHIELIQATKDGVYALKNGEGIHHIGMFADEYAARPNADQTCLPPMRTVHLGGRQISRVTNPADLNGLRIEISTTSPEVLTAWLAGKPPA